jgi:glutamate formiminotransferase
MLIECVPNISEGRRRDVVSAIASAVDATDGVRLLDCSSDESHNRSVLTMAGDAAPLEAAVLAMFDLAVRHIDLRSHTGEHPRLGAVDVVPFVPLEGATMADCVSLARNTASAVAERFEIPVFLYEAAATRPERTKLEDIRRGQFEGLAAKLATPEWEPDFGPSRPHPTAGASVIGARMPLVAYNINLDTDRLDVARAIAARVRTSSGGLPFVKAMGISLADRGLVQVSMNLTDFTRTPIRAVFDLVQREAQHHGVRVLESEIVGLVPAAALPASAEQDFKLAGFSPDQILENRLRSSRQSEPIEGAG